MKVLGILVGAAALALCLPMPPAMGADVPSLDELKPGFDLEQYEFSYEFEEMRFGA